MSASPFAPLLERQVELVCEVVSRRAGMCAFLRAEVVPHLEKEARRRVLDAAKAIDDSDRVDAALAATMKAAVADIRRGIKADTRKERVEIPAELLLSRQKGVFEVRTVEGPKAEALRAALGVVEKMHTAVISAVEFADAVRIGAAMLDLD